MSDTPRDVQAVERVDLVKEAELGHAWHGPEKCHCHDRMPALLAEVRALRALFIEYRKWHRTEYHNNNELEERVNQVLGEYK